MEKDTTMEDRSLNNSNSEKHKKILWEEHQHYGYILPNLRYKIKDNSFYFYSDKGFDFLDKFHTEINLNICQRSNFIRIIIREFNIILNKYENNIYTIQYHICREERDDGIICIIGIPDFIYLNNNELNKIGKCVEMHILKINNKKTFNLNYMFNENNDNEYENEDKENYDINKINQNIKERINKIDSLKIRSILL